MSVSCDFETHSTIDLTKTTTDVYAKHPTTDVWCMSWAVDDEPVQLLRPEDSFPEELREQINQGEIFWAWSCQFEQAIWTHIMVPRYGWPPIPEDQWGDPMAMAYAMSLPGSLDGASAALGIDQRKDAKGARLMKMMARPREIKEDGAVVWWDDEERRSRLEAYCRQDTEVERATRKRLVNLPPIEWQTWRLDYRINQTGLPIDRPAVKAALRLVESEKARLDRAMERVTGGVVKKCTWVAPLTDWLRWHGVETPGIAKADIRALLARSDLPDVCRQALELRAQAAKSSTAKLQTMLDCLSEDDRIRGAFQYHGAGTGRWAGRKVQSQNFPRGFLKPHEVEDAIDLMQRGERDTIDMLYGDPLDVVSSCLRGMIAAPPGCEFTTGDFANIEGRKAAWMAGEEWKLQAFRDFDTILDYDEKGKPIRKGADLYKVAYSNSFGVPIKRVTDAERQVGKVAELSLQFGGGVGAFETMSKNYGVNMEDYYSLIVASTPASVLEKARDAFDQRGKDSGIAKPRWLASEITKLLWRQQHPAITQAWADCEQAVIEAVESPGKVTAGARMRFRKAGSFLFCQLPSGRCLCYPYPEIRERETPWGTKRPQLTYMGVDTYTRKWCRQSTYGGDVFQSGVQGSARDVLRDAMLRLDSKGLTFVGTVHDEGITEQPAGSVEADAVFTEMARVPDWAAGLPIAVEGWQGRRYRK